MNVTTTPIDSVTHLVRLPEGKVGIRWAGCLFGPEDSLDKICKEPLLSQAQALLDDPTTPWASEIFHDVDDGLGLRNLELGTI